MTIRARLALPSLLAVFAAATCARAEDVELGKFVGAVEKPAAPAEAPAPAPVPQQNPAPAPAPAPAANPGANESDRALANAILKDCNDIATATNLWAQEKKKAPKTRVTLRDIVPYMKPDSPVVTSGGNDRLGNPYDFGTADAGPYVSPNTLRDLGMPSDFWGDYAPRNGATASNSSETADPSDEPSGKSSSNHTPTRRRSSPPPERTFGRKIKDFFKGR